MNGNNSDMTGIAYFLVFAALAAVGLFYIFALFAAIYGVVALFALSKPLKLGKTTLYPSEARAYLIRGVVGLILSPALVGLFASLFKVRIDPDWLPHIVLGIFAFSTLGIQYLMQSFGILCEEERAILEAQAKPTAVPERTVPPPRESAKSYEFASWEDEDPYK